MLPCFVKRRRKLFPIKKNYSSKETYVRVNKEITKFCYKLSMKVNLSVEFDKEKYKLTTNLMFTKVKNYDMNLKTSPSKSVNSYP